MHPFFLAGRIWENARMTFIKRAQNSKMPAWRFPKTSLRFWRMARYVCGNKNRSLRESETNGFCMEGFGCICEINEDAPALWGLFFGIADATRGIPHPEEIIRELDAVFRNAGKERCCCRHAARLFARGRQCDTLKSSAKIRRYLWKGKL